jgi:hypothetical protein
MARGRKSRNIKEHVSMLPLEGATSSRCPTTYEQRPTWRVEPYSRPKQ